MRNRQRMILNITVTIKCPTLLWHHPTSTGFVANAPMRMRAGPCHFCQTAHPKRKAVVVSVPTSAPALPNAATLQAFASMLPTKPACIHQPARSSGSVIDLSAPDAVQTVASAASLVKAVSIDQPAPCSSGSVIDLSAPDAVQAVASASPAKPVFIRQPAPCSSGSVIDLSTPDAVLAPAKSIIDIARNDAVEENRVLANHMVLAIVVGQLKSREQEATYRCRALEESLDRERSNNHSQQFVIHGNGRIIVVNDL